MKVIDSLLRRPVGVLTVACGMAALGLYAALQLPLAFGEGDGMDRLTIRSAWPGAMPLVIESRWTRVLESAAAGLDGVARVNSVSERGGCAVDVFYEPGTDMALARLMLKSRLAALAGRRPQGALPPTVQPVGAPADESRPLIIFEVTGSHPASRLRALAAGVVRNRLLAVPGVSEVRIIGGERWFVRVVLDSKRMRAARLRAPLIWAALRTAAGRQSESMRSERGREITLVTAEPSVAGLANLPLAGSSGTVRLRDVADIRLVEQPAEQRLRIDGQDAVTVMVRSRNGADLLQTAASLRDAARSLQARLPHGISLRIRTDASTGLRERIQRLISRGMFSAAVCFCLLWCAYRSFRVALVIAATGMLAVGGAAAVLGVYAKSVSLFSLAGLALAAGVLIDSAIVVVNSILYRNAATPAEAVREVVHPLTAQAATTCLIFLPLLYMQGAKPDAYGGFAAAMGVYVLLSLIAAMTVAPVFCSRLPVRTAGRRRKRTLLTLYTEHAYANPRRTGVLVLAMAVAIWLTMQGRVTIEAGDDRDDPLTVSLHARPVRPAAVEEMAGLAGYFESGVPQHPAVSQTRLLWHSGAVRLLVRVWDGPAAHLAVHSIRSALVARAGRLSGVNISVSGGGETYHLNGGAVLPATFRFRLAGYSYAELERQARTLAGWLRRQKFISRVDTSSGLTADAFSRRSERVLRESAPLMSASGFSRGAIAARLNSDLTGGSRGLTLNKDGQNIEIEVWPDRRLASTERTVLDEILVEEGTVPSRIGKLTTIVDEPFAPRIVRQNRSYVRWVAFACSGPDVFTRELEARAQRALTLPAGYSLRLATARLEPAGQVDAIRALALAIGLVFMVTAAIFERVLPALVVALMITAAAAGIAGLCFGSGRTIDLTAVSGILIILGILANQALLFIDALLRKKHAGHKGAARVLAAFRQRLRPALISAATTVAGLLPLFAFDGNSRILAILIFVGISLGTVFSILLLPVAARLILR